MRWGAVGHLRHPVEHLGDAPSPGHRLAPVVAHALAVALQSLFRLGWITGLALH